MKDLLWFPADLIYRFPFLPLFPALGLAFYWIMKRGDAGRRASIQTGGLLVLISAVLWMAYAVLEGAIALMEGSSGSRGAPIRIDVFLIYPLLLITLPASFFGILKMNRSFSS